MKIIRTTGQQSALSEFFCDQQFLWLQPGIRAFVVLVSVINFVFPETMFGGADSSPKIRIRVNNYTQASAAILTGAEREAARILGKAGLQTVWLDCPAGHPTGDPKDSCREPLEATDIALRVLSESTQNKFQDTVFGFAVVPVLASVYYDYAAYLARSDNAEFEIPIILGCVIAHEVGHLLLGSSSHADTGVMQGHWGRGQIRRAMTGTLLFTQEQARLIRAETQKRMRLQTSAPRERSEASAELTTGGVADAEPQNVSSINTKPLLLVHRSAQHRHPRMIVRFNNYAPPSETRITGEPQRSAPARHFVCDKGYTLKQCDEELVVLKKALAKYPIPELGEWTWVLVRSEHWRLTLLTQTLDPGIPALTEPAARATFFDDALVTGASGRMSELMTLWHMGRLQSNTISSLFSSPVRPSRTAAIGV